MLPDSKVPHHHGAPHLDGHDGLLPNPDATARPPPVEHDEVRSDRYVAQRLTRYGYMCSWDWVMADGEQCGNRCSSWRPSAERRVSPPASSTVYTSATPARIALAYLPNERSEHTRIGGCRRMKSGMTVLGLASCCCCSSNEVPGHVCILYHMHGIGVIDVSSRSLWDTLLVRILHEPLPCVSVLSASLLSCSLHRLFSVSIR
jgi:hypothetical protein